MFKLTNLAKQILQKTKKINNDQRGIGLVEVLAALAISVIVIVSLVSLSIFTLRNSLESKLMLEATKYANTEIELVRASRDTNPWTNGVDGFYDMVAPCGYADANANGTPDVRCYVAPAPSLSVISVGESSDPKVYGSGGDKIFIYFTSEVITAQNIRINVYAKWYVGNNVRTTSVHTDFTNWANN